MNENKQTEPVAGKPYGYLRLKDAKFFHDVEMNDQRILQMGYLPLYDRPAPAVAVNEQMLDAAKLAKNHIHSASLCTINSMSSRSEMLHLMEKAIGQLGAAIAAAEQMKGGVV